MCTDDLCFPQSKRGIRFNEPRFFPVLILNERCAKEIHFHFLICIRTTEAGFMLMGALHSSLPQTVLFFIIVHSFFHFCVVIGVIMVIGLFACENSSIAFGQMVNYLVSNLRTTFCFPLKTRISCKYFPIT